ncbi:MAG: hypothetical protein HYV24_02735 [Deltaproteobacteria bacterium]|nr:hypothetical protein [Deltaproteobacteria bacterium]
MLINPEISNVSIVLVGNFNPIIFRPEWFEKHDILSKDDTEKTKVKIVHPEISDFQNEWLNLQVQTSKFTVSTSEPPYVKLFDFVVKTFKEYLSHTPISKLGINREVHFSANDLANRDRIGKILAPREPWGEWGKLIDAGEGEEHGGMANLTMQIKKLDDREKGMINITVQPSSKAYAGILVSVNDHFELSDTTTTGYLDSNKIMDLLVKKFDTSLENSEKIINQIMGLV